MASHYQEITDDLRQLIVTGSLAPGEQLPSEARLASRYGVSVPTLRLALDVLQGEGLVEKHQGRGNFVRRPLNRMSYEGGGLRTDYRAAARLALDVIVSTHEIRAQGRVAALLQVRKGSWVTEYTYLTSQERSPHSLARIYVPQSVATLPPMETSRSPWGHDIQDRLAEAGVQLASVTDRLVARLPTADEARRLRTSTKTAVLEIERTSADAAGRVVEGAVLVLPGHRAEALFTTRLPVSDLEGVR